MWVLLTNIIKPGKDDSVKRKLGIFYSAKSAAVDLQPTAGVNAIACKKL
jgi:hypothetical protein